VSDGAALLAAPFRFRSLAMISRFQHLIQSAGALALLAAVTCLTSGCASTDGHAETRSASLAIDATSRSIYEGEIVTVTTRSNNTLGTDASIEWTTTGGELDTEENGRIARIKFDRPGRYMVMAKLKVDGNVVDTDHVEIAVRELVRYDDGHDRN
jgi:hypothetical protein